MGETMDSRFHENEPDHRDDAIEVVEPHEASPHLRRAPPHVPVYDDNSYHEAAIVRAEAVRLDMLYPRQHR